MYIKAERHLHSQGKETRAHTGHQLRPERGARASRTNQFTS